MTKILLVEDDKSLREIYNVRLGAEGYDIVSAGDGEEALALAIKERPDLIVSDVMMPKISGFDMLDILRSTTETKNVKVIMMTALSNEEQRRRGLALGADRYLVKSQVGIEDVVRTVHEVLEDNSSTASGPAPLVSSEDTDDDIYDISTPERTEATSVTMTRPRPGTTSSITLPTRPNPSAAPQSSQPRIITQPTPTPIAPPVSPPSTTTTASPAPEAIPTAFTAPDNTPLIDLSAVTDRPDSDSFKQEPTLPSAIAANAPQPVTSPTPITPQPQPSTPPVSQAQTSPIPPQQPTSAPTTTSTSPSYTVQSTPISQRTTAPIAPQTATPAQGGSSTKQPATNQTTPPLAAAPPLSASSAPPAQIPTPATASSNTSGSGLEFEETARADTPASQSML